jgi:excisionase family DNA binding protein
MKALILTFVLSLALSLDVLTPSSLGLHEFHAAIPLAAAAVAANVEPIFVSVAAAAEILATSRSEIYQKLARGELEAVKDGARTKITFESVKRAAAALPKASIKLYTPRRGRAREQTQQSLK